MGLAIAAGITAVAAAGSAAYSINAANKAKKEAAANAAGLKGGVARAGESVPNVAPVAFDRLKLAPINDIFKGYLGQASQLPGVTKFAMAQNDAWQKILNKASPGLTGSVKEAGRLVDTRLRGELSAETRANIARSGAQQSLQGGFGADSDSGRALEARDLGRKTEDLQTQGYSMLPQQVQMAGALSPVAPHTVFFTPQQIGQRMDNAAMFNTQVGNSEKAYNTSLDFENQNAKFASLMNMAGINYQANSQVATAQAAFDQSVAQGIQQVGSAAAGAGGGLQSSGYYGSLGGAQKAAPYTSGFSYTQGMGYTPRATQAYQYGAGGTFGQ